MTGNADVAATFCTSCGARLEAGYRFCGACGDAVSAPALKEEPPSRPQDAVDGPPGQVLDDMSSGRPTVIDDMSKLVAQARGAPPAQAPESEEASRLHDEPYPPAVPGP